MVQKESLITDDLLEQMITILLLAKSSWWFMVNDMRLSQSERNAASVAYLTVKDVLDSI